MKIIVADFGNYPLIREKIIMGKIIKCGIGNLFDGMAMFSAGVHYDVTLVVNLADNTGEKKSLYYWLQKRYPFIETVIFRNNVGADFGAYNAGYQLLKKKHYEGDVLFVNSSASGPSHKDWLLKYSQLFHQKEDIGLCGASLNSHTSHLEKPEFKPHVQSFFMLTSMAVLKRVFPDSLPGYDFVGHHLELVSKGEIEFSQRIIDSGYGICCWLFDYFIYYKGSKWEIPFGDLRYTEQFNRFANII